MICDNCIKRDVCIHLKRFNDLKFESNTVKIAIDECPHQYLREEVSFDTKKLELPVCELCGEKCYERFTCKECGRKVCIDCAASYEINDLKEEVECICYECVVHESEDEKSEVDKMIDELF